MKYHIEIAEKLEKKFNRIPNKERERIIEKIDLLAENPRPQGCKKLKGNKQLPLYRVRVGDYRIIYAIEDKILLVLIIDVGNRKNIYKD
ncbi:MAG: type II toxin-antitoxin system RelE/ParE family toxin [Chlamydiales bacterium]